MFEIAKSSAILFLRGKLFRNTNEVIRQLLIGIAVTIIVFLTLAKFGGLPLAGIIAGFVGGALQPALFKNLKFR